MCSQQIPSLCRASGSHSAELAGPLAVSEVPCSSEALVLSLGTLAGRVGEGPESGRGSSLELVCRGMTGWGRYRGSRSGRGGGGGLAACPARESCDPSRAHKISPCVPPALRGFGEGEMESLKA